MQMILVPTDFSPEARNAATYAAEIARIFHAKIFLFHAYMLPTPVSEVPYVMITVDELQKENESLIKKEAQFLNDTYNLEIEWMVRIGIPSDEIKVFTQERRMDMAVMGMKGAGGIDKIIGSTTTNVIRKIKIPIIVIPHNARFTPIKNITYASDFSYKTDFHLFDPLIKLAKILQAKIHIVHVYRQNAMQADEIAGKSNLEKIFTGIDHEFYSVSDTSITHGINDFMEHHKSELLVMVEHKHSFFERLFTRDHTTAMAYETKSPLLILQDKN